MTKRKETELGFKVAEPKTKYEIPKKKEYKGSKWGKYLKASAIFFTILKKGKGKLAKLRDIVIKTQRNTLESFKKITVLEENYSVNDNYPYLSSVRDVITIKVDVDKLPRSIERTTKKKINYIIADVISNRFLGERLFFIEGGDFVVSDTFFIALLKKNYDRQQILAILNSTFSLFIVEIIGRKNLGGGLLTIYGPELENLILIDPMCLEDKATQKLLNIYSRLSVRPIKSIFEECGFDYRLSIRGQEPNPLPDRKELDEIIFDTLNLTSEERKEVYFSVCELVKGRHEKAKTIMGEEE